MEKVIFKIHPNFNQKQYSITFAKGTEFINVDFDILGINIMFIGEPATNDSQKHYYFEVKPFGQPSIIPGSKWLGTGKYPQTQISYNLYVTTIQEAPKEDSTQNLSIETT